MDLLIEMFLGRAIKRGLLSELQCAILREMRSSGGSLEELVVMVLNFGVSRERDKIIDLAEEVEGDWDRMSVQDKMLVTTRAITDDKKVGGDTRGLDWFCFFAISDGGITKEIALSIAAEIEDLADVLMFAQAVVDHWQIADYSKIQKCVEKAMLMVQRNMAPPYSIFAKDEPKKQEPSPSVEAPPSPEPPPFHM